MGQNGWGGARKGAGRKKGDTNYVTISVTLPDYELEFLKSMVATHNISVSRFIRKYLGLETAARFRKKLSSKEI